MKTGNMALSVLMASIAISAYVAFNLVKDADVIQRPVSPEFRLFGSAKQGSISA